MTTFAKEAARELVLFDLGLRSHAEIVAWADDLIVQTERPNFDLIELSTSKVGDSVAVRSALIKLRDEVDEFSGLDSAMPTVLQCLRSDRSRAPEIAVAFWSIAVAHRYDVPCRYSFFLRFEDAFSLAEDGTFGSMRDVTDEFIGAVEAAIPEPRVD